MGCSRRRSRTSSVAATRSGASESKTIVVTGGSRGIGRAVALGAGALGWSVGVGYRDDRAAADEVVAAIEADGGRAVATRGDVAVEEDVIALFDATSDAFGRLDGAVVNAASPRRRGRSSRRTSPASGESST